MQQPDDVELVQLLQALCSADKAERSGAEAVLAGGQLQRGFPGRLSHFAAAGPSVDTAFPLRQMAFTILKRLANDKWADVSEEDALAVKGALCGAIALENKGLRGLHQACVAAIRSQRGCQWPELHSALALGVKQGTAHEVACCVEVVAVLLDECNFDVAVALGPLLEPMLGLASSDATPPAIRRKCVDAHQAGIGALLANDMEISAPSVHPWLAVHAQLCVGVEGWSEQDRVACAFTATRTVAALSRHRGLQEAIAGAMEEVLRPACMLVAQIEPGYSNTVVQADDEGASEEDGGVAQLIAQVMELIQVMLAMPKLRTALKGRVKGILSLFVPFMRITEAQVNAWRADPNEFLAHEDDEHVRGCAVRLSGEGLVGELLANCRREASHAIVVVVHELLELKGLENWKSTEVALFIFGIAVAEASVKSLQRGELKDLLPLVLRTAAGICADSAAPEFLRARAFVVLTKSSDVITELHKKDVPDMLRAAAGGLATKEPLTVRVCALRGFCRFLSAVDTGVSTKLLVDHGVLASLASLVQGADDELLHLALECLCVIVRLLPSAMVSVAASLAALILEIWRRSASDPLVHLQVLDLVSICAASDPSLQRTMEEVMTPAVMADLQPGVDPIATASVVELYGVLLKRATVPLCQGLWECASPLLDVVLRSDESRLLQNSCESLVTLVRRVPTQIVDGGLLEKLLLGLGHLLGPNLDDDACLFVGPFAMLILAQYGSMMPAHLTVSLLGAVVTRLARAERPYLQQELIVVCARLLHEDLQGVLAALAGMSVPAGGKEVNGLELLLTIWLRNVKEIRARRARNVSVSALCRLHTRCVDDEQLRSLRPGGAGEPPLVEQLLAAILQGLEFENERCRKLREVKHAAVDDSDDEDEDDDDDEEIDDDDDRRGLKGGRLLSELLDLEDFEDDDDDGDDGGGDTFHQLEKADPLASLDIRRVALEHLVQHAGGVAGRPELASRIASAVAEARANP